MEGGHIPSERVGDLRPSPSVGHKEDKENSGDSVRVFLLPYSGVQSYYWVLSGLYLTEEKKRVSGE